MNTVPATAQKPKLKPNLTSVTPAGPPVEAPEIDTTTPIDISVIPFTHRDQPKWSAWMIGRMGEFWPHIGVMNYAGIMNQHMGQNSSLFIRAKKAILLAVVTRETLDPRPIVDIIFCFKHIPDDEQQNKDVRLLYRRVEDWAKHHGARYVRIMHPERIDMTQSRIKDALWCEEDKMFLKDLDK